MTCRPERRCRGRRCETCGPIREGDDFRKFRDNLLAYGGRVLLISVTPPGADLLPWDCPVAHRHSGLNGCRVRRTEGHGWNLTASRRYARMMKAAYASADRLVRRYGCKQRLPRRAAVVWSEQKRGLWHVHEALPAATRLERVWSRQVVTYVDNAQRRERSMPVDERRLLLDVERHLETAAPNVYGWGYIDRNPLRQATAKQLALPNWPECDLEVVWRLLSEPLPLTRAPWPDYAVLRP